MDPHIRSPKVAAVDLQEAVEQVFGRNGWQVEKISTSDRTAADLLISGHGQLYHAVVKGLAEGRADRATPLFAQALLEARRHASEGESPAVIIWVGKASRALAIKLRDF